MKMLDYNRRTGYSDVGDKIICWRLYDGRGRMIAVIHKLVLFRSPTFLSRDQLKPFPTAFTSIDVACQMVWSPETLEIKRQTKNLGQP